MGLGRIRVIGGTVKRGGGASEGWGQKDTAKAPLGEK